MQDANDKISEARRAARLAAAELDELADAFSVCGNDRLGKRLSRVSADLENAANILSQAQGELASSYLRDSAEASTNVIRAAIAGIQSAGRSAS